MNTQLLPVGEQVRHWRQRRRLSQLDLACEAEISTRHLSFIETGRAAPSREMILHLAESLDVPLRQRNNLLLAAGFAPVFQERSLDDPALRPAREAIEALLNAHEPYPALAIDRHWNLIAANRAVAPLLAGAAPELLQAPINVLRLSLHPKGVAPRIANLPEWREHLLFRLRRQFAETADPLLSDLLAELTAYPHGGTRSRTHDLAAIAVPLQLRTDYGVLSLLSATMMFGTPLDPTLSELALETFLPADAATAEALRRLAVERRRRVCGRSASVRLAKDGEAPHLETAIDVAQAGLPHPLHLVLDRSAAVVRHALLRLSDLVGGRAEFFDLLQPEAGVTRLGDGFGAERLFGIDEQAVVNERTMYAAEKSFLRGIVEMVDGER